MKLLFLTIPKLANTLAGNLFQKIFLCIQLWYFVLTRKILKISGDFLLTAVYNDTDFRLWLRYPMDIAVLREVFIEKEYEWFPVEDPKVIIDFGAHFGDTTLYYHLQYPDAKIYAVEPSPETFKRLEKNVSGISNIVPIQTAISNMDGEVEFYTGPSSIGDSFKKRADSEQKVSVPSYTLKKFFEKHNIEKADIIKFDIEGGEESMFSGVSPEDYARAFIGEVHEDLMSIDFKEFTSKFSAFSVQDEKLSKNGRYIIKALRK